MVPAGARAARGCGVQQVLRIKILSMGDAGTGKSCLIKRYCEEKFVSKYISTIGVDFGVKGVSIGDWLVKVNLWDLAGGDEFFEVRNEFYREAQGVLLTYDVNSRASFAALDAWLEESERFGARDAIVVVAANKTDLKRRVVSEEEGRSWAEQNGFLFFEVSAATGERVKPLFSALFARVLATINGPDADLVASAAAIAANDVLNEGLVPEHYGLSQPRAPSRGRAGAPAPRLSVGASSRHARPVY